MTVLQAPTLPRVLFGDNQFFGVNHMSEDRARAQAMRFQSLDAVLDVLRSAREVGIASFMCTTHARVSEIVRHVERTDDVLRDLEFLPCMPYAHKYANAVTEDGLLGALKRFLPNDGLVDAAVRGGRTVATKDMDALVTLLVDAELKPFQNVPTPVIFLQNVVVDLLLGLGFDRGFQVFHDHVRSRYGAEPGFITMNAPMLAHRLGELGIRRPVICANFNALGFRMSGGPEAYRQMLDSGEVRFIAMSVLASGALEPREALTWVRSHPEVEAVVFGASTAAHIARTKALVDELWTG